MDPKPLHWLEISRSSLIHNASQFRNSGTHTLSPGDAVGYSASYQASGATYMSVLPVGYSDGLVRHLGNLGQVYAHKQLCPIIGHISMNFTTISTPTLLPEGEIVEVLGPHIPADTIAANLDTINYEIVARLNPTIPRLLV